MGHSIFEPESVEGRRKLIAAGLAARAVRMNQFDSPPGFEGFEHDERESGQEEVYVALRGAGVLRVGGGTIELVPGRYVLVSPDETRQVVAGQEGLSYLVVGAVVGEEA